MHSKNQVKNVIQTGLFLGVSIKLIFINLITNFDIVMLF